MRYDPTPFYSSGTKIGGSISFAGIASSQLNVFLSFLLLVVGISFFLIVHLTIKSILSFDKGRVDSKMNDHISKLKSSKNKISF